MLSTEAHPKPMLTDDPQTNDTPGNLAEFKKTIEANAGKDIDPDTQDMLNKPFSADGTTLSEEDNALIQDIVSKVDSGEINLYQPSSVINQEVYDGLSGEDKAKTDLFLNATLFVMRQIHAFNASEHSNDSDMMINMVQELRLKKETLETEVGDVLKI